MKTGAAEDRWFARPGRGAIVLALVALSMLAGCTTTQNTAPPPSTTTAMLTYPAAPANIAITITELQGNWGLASYRNVADRVRTEGEAKAACNNPYVVTAGSAGGVMMYLADQAQPSEVFVKTGPQGQTFIGPQGTAGIPQDRVVLEYANNVLVADWMDASARERYGTMIFVRCGVA